MNLNGFYPWPVHSLFLGIGVGHEVALQWYRTGHRSLDDVIKRERLTSAQKVGIEFYHEFLEKYGFSPLPSPIEVTVGLTSFLSVLQDVPNWGGRGGCHAHETSQFHSWRLPIYDMWQLSVCSNSNDDCMPQVTDWHLHAHPYLSLRCRRNCTAMGDVDILITHENEQRTFGFLSKLLDILQSKGFFFFFVLLATTEFSLYVLICNVLIYILLYDRSSDAHSKC